MKFNPGAVSTIDQGTVEMQKTRATTIQQRFGFQDPDLTTPAHDALMVWLDGAMDAIVLAKQHLWSSEHISNLRQEVEMRGGKLPSDVPQFQPPSVKQKIWEKSILDRNYTIGFIDMAVEVKTFELTWTYRTGIKVDVAWDVNAVASWLYFEVKPSVSSVGEVIRQIRLYQPYAPGKYYIVSPDDRFASILEDQGIGFVKAMSSQYESF